MEQLTQEQIAQKLISKNIRPSVQRIAILNYLIENPIHPTVDTIYLALSPSIPTLSKTTVYNTLKQFAELNLVQTITIEDGELRYDADTSNHIHFKCNSCGKIFDIFSSIEIPINVIPEGFEIQKTQTNIWGLCKDCSTQTK